MKKQKQFFQHPDLYVRQCAQMGVKMNIFKSNRKGKKEHSPIKHMLHMVLCCGLPVVILIFLPAIAGVSPALAGLLGMITPFICPIMMGLMMFMMFRGRDKHSCCDNSKTEAREQLPHESE